MNEALNFIAENWVVIGTALLAVIAVIVKITPTKEDDKAFAKLRAILSKITGGKLGVVGLVAFFGLSCALSTGCAYKQVQDLEPHKQAIFYSTALMDTCQDIEDAYKDTLAQADQQRAHWLKHNVAPVINAARHSIILASEAAHAWAVVVDSGGDIQAAVSNWSTLFSDAKAMLASATLFWDNVKSGGDS